MFAQFHRLRMKFRRGRVQTVYLVLLAAFFAGMYFAAPLFSAEGGASGGESEAAHGEAFQWFSPFTSPKFDPLERGALLGVEIIPGHTVPVRGQVARQVGAHHAQPHHSELVAAHPCPFLCDKAHPAPLPVEGL